jgi:hypothetical protein
LEHRKCDEHSNIRKRNCDSRDREQERWVFRGESGRLSGGWKKERGYESRNKEEEE